MTRTDLFPRWEIWLRRGTAAALVALALALVGLGIALYAPAAGERQAQHDVLTH